MTLTSKEKFAVIVLAVIVVSIAINYLNDKSWPQTIIAAIVALTSIIVIIKLSISLTNKTTKK